MLLYLPLPCHASAMSCYYLSIALHSYPGSVGNIRRSLAGVHYGSQDTTGAVYGPNLHCAHMPILEVVVRLETFPLHQLLLCVHPRTLHKIAKDVRVLHGWPKTHVVLKPTIVPLSKRVIIFFQFKYLTLAAGSRDWYSSLISPRFHCYTTGYTLTFPPTFPPT